MPVLYQRHNAETAQARRRLYMEEVAKKINLSKETAYAGSDSFLADLADTMIDKRKLPHPRFQWTSKIRYTLPLHLLILFVQYLKL